MSVFRVLFRRRRSWFDPTAPTMVLPAASVDLSDESLELIEAIVARQLRRLVTPPPSPREAPEPASLALAKPADSVTSLPGPAPSGNLPTPSNLAAKGQAADVVDELPEGYVLLRVFADEHGVKFETLRERLLGIHSKVLRLRHRGRPRPAAPRADLERVLEQIVTAKAAR